MAGYWMVRANVTDSEKLARYAPLAAASVAKFGGRYLARGGAATFCEGPEMDRLVIVEYPSYEIARQAYDSADYQAALAALDDGAIREFAILDGVAS